MNTKKSPLFVIAFFAAINMNIVAADGSEKGLKHRVEALEETVALLQAALAAEREARLALTDKLACVADDSDDTNVYFDGCNVHVRNGLELTDSINGVGNLIVGYDTARTVDPDKTGSHNIVIGDEHNYSSYGGLVVGFQNTVSGAWSSVSGGVFNRAEGMHSSVSGGRVNRATGDHASVSGGFRSRASGRSSSVSGGFQNRASGDWSSVSGGSNSVASGVDSSISGGNFNVASGFGSSVSGGFDNRASGSSGSISGGFLNTAEGIGSSVSGGDSNTASADASSVSGGRNNTTSGDTSSVSGGHGCETVLDYGWAVGDTTTTTGCVISN